MSTLTKNDLVKDLRALGLAQGQIVLMHSSLASLGRVADGAETVIQALLEILGPAGTLVVPIFGDLGILTKTVEKHPQAVKSVHPLAAVAAIGKDAKEICRDHWKAELAHGEETPYTRIAALGGFVLLLGVDQDRNTTLHTVEELLRHPYLNTTDEKTFLTPEGEVTRRFPFFPGPHRDFIGVDGLLRRSGRMTTGRVGRAVARLVASRDLIEVVSAEGRVNPAWALCHNPSCADCVGQHAALRRDRFARESFRLSASSKLAGRFVPEMIENLKAAGIGAVELDWVQGKAASAMSEAALTATVAEFKRAGLAVPALRVPVVTGRSEAILNNAKAAGIGRVLMPLSFRSAVEAKLAAAFTLELSFLNPGMTAEVVSEVLLNLKAEGLSPRVVFGAAGFARAGEKPFLKSYKQKLRRFIDQLDIEDARFDGAATPLAQGNAEIKEMISILRCASFDGWFVLSAGEAPVEPLQKVTERFVALLEAM